MTAPGKPTILDEISRLGSAPQSPLQRLFAPLDRLVFKDEEEFLENDSLSIETRVDLVSRLNDVNRRSGYHTVLLMELLSLVKSLPAALRPVARPLRILDIGVGGGALLERIHEWSLRHEIPVELYGIDVDKNFLAKTAEALASKNILATLIAGSGQDLHPIEDGGVDIVVCSYVVHHVRTLESLKNFFAEIHRVARLGWLVVDMERRFWGPPFAWFSGYLFGASTALVWDGVKSMRRAYTSPEINTVLRHIMPGPEQGGMICQPHPAFPYWLIKGKRVPPPSGPRTLSADTAIKTAVQTPATALPHPPAEIRNRRNSS